MPSFTTKLETPRLILRPFTMDDVVPSYQINLHPEMTRYTNDGGAKSLEEMEATIRQNVLGDYKKYGFGRFAVVHKESNEFIGFSGLKYLDDFEEVDIGYRLAVPYWGQGLATESCKAVMQFGLETLGLKRIVGFILPENKASLNVLLKLGFEFEKEVEDEGEIAHQYSFSK